MSDDFYDEKGPITLTDKQQAEFWETQARGLTKVADEYLGIIKKNGVKIKELMAKLALAEGEWKTYAKSCESLSKKLAEAELLRDCNASQRDSAMMSLKVAVEAIKMSRHYFECEETPME